MNKFKKVKTFIKDLIIIEPTIFNDDRGYFFETYSKNDFFELGIKYNFVQDNESSSIKGTLRGLHFQIENIQGKLIRVLYGEIFDVAVDLRRESKTFGKWFGINLSSDNKKMFFIPPRFAHGFLTLSNKAEIFYKCTDIYNLSAESGIFYNDKDLNILWPENKFILSEKDKKWQSFKGFEKSDIWKDL